MTRQRKAWSLATLSLLAAAALYSAQNANQRFERLMRDLLILDSHIDTPGYIVDEGYQLGEEHRYYETDIPRLKRGKVGAVFFGIYVQPQDFPPERWVSRALEWVDAVHEEARKNSRDLTRVHSRRYRAHPRRRQDRRAAQPGRRPYHPGQSSDFAQLLPARSSLHDAGSFPDE